jgi:ATP-dependent helicase/nuclease subunit B
LIDVAERRVRLLRRLAQQWTQAPPAVPLIAAGSTGTAPAAAALMAAVARAPRGLVALPGLDRELAEDAWDRVGEQHPQGAMKRLLARVGVARAEVRTWPGGPATANGRWRRRLIQEALRPAEATADWRDQIAKLRQDAPPQAGDPIALGLEGLAVIAGRGEEDTALIAALLLRETLQTPGKTAALITPDRDLARRVSAQLSRWGVVVDSSAGEPLSRSPVGVLMGLLARAAMDPCDPVRLLSILKHSFTRLGLAAEARQAGLRALERRGLRGARPRDWAELEARLQSAGEAQAAELLERTRQALAPASPGPEPLGAAVRARGLTEALEALAADAGGRLGGLWAGPAGEAAAGLISALIEQSEGLPPITPAGFVQLLDGLMGGETVRLGAGSHPRLSILGAIEARLVRADRVILAGLEEGVWPQGAPIDPLLSRPMRAALGLPPPERRIGLAAHDFAQAACAPEVYLLHSERREGAPAVESRWLWRLKTLARGAGLALPGRPELALWTQALDAPGPYAPLARTQFAPPLAARPTRLPVTQAEALTRDPYAVYARYVLALYPLERPDEPMEARARGTAIHRAFERFAKAWPRELPPDAAARFEDLYLAALIEAGAPPSALAREQALAREAGQWVAEAESRRRAGGVALAIEQEGRLTFDVCGRPFTLTAKADRIELDRAGYGHVLDFKTGKVPSEKEVERGFSPQLTLTAAILAEGGFAELGPRRPGDLVYLRVTGRRPAGEEIIRGVRGDDSAGLAAKALDGLKALLGRFADSGYPYRSRTAPQFVKDRAGDYDHLARVLEWSASGEEEEG